MDNEENNVIICENCYAENKKGEKYCFNCGKLLFYNDSKNLTKKDTIEDELAFYDENNFDNTIEFNENMMSINKKRKIICFYYKEMLDRIIFFNNIIECQIIKDSNIMEAGGIGRALAGGFIAGEAGAIVGATTRKSKNIVSNLSIRIVTNELDEPLYNLELLDFKLDINKSLDEKFFKSAMQFANSVYATIQAIINDNKNVSDNKEIEDKESNNGLEQLEKLAELKEKGIITQEEFEKSKKKILSKL